MANQDAIPLLSGGRILAERGWEQQTNTHVSETPWPHIAGGDNALPIIIVTSTTAQLQISLRCPQQARFAINCACAVLAVARPTATVILPPTYLGRHVRELASGSTRSKLDELTRGAMLG